MPMPMEYSHLHRIEISDTGNGNVICSTETPNNYNSSEPITLLASNYTVVTTEYDTREGNNLVGI
jgi:hypothetical protein